MRLTMIGVAFVFSSLLSGCDGYNEINTRNSVIDEFPGGEIVENPKRKWQYIVRAANGDVWLVETMNQLDPKISAKTLILPVTAKFFSEMPK